jgi:hypothetical protein
MRVTIIAVENRVNVEGYSEPVDCSALDEDINVIQWHGTVGEIEFKTNYVENTRRPNESITDFSPYQPLVAVWEASAKKEPAAALPPAAEAVAHAS